MSKLYQSPLRVYLALFCLALWGLTSGLNLPVSLFPNSSKPTIAVEITYGSLTAEEFVQSYGSDLERSLRAASFDNHEVEHVRANYDRTSVQYEVEYAWESPPVEANRRIKEVANAFAARMPEEIRDTLQIWTRSGRGGFLAVSFYSTARSVDELYDYLDPIFSPKLATVSEAGKANLWNPLQKEIRIELNPEKMALFGLMPRDIQRSISPALQSSGGGTVTVGLSSLGVTMDRTAFGLRDLSLIPIRTASGQAVHLADIATIDLSVPIDKTQVMKTSGATSVILWAEPKPGGNIKKMAEDILKVVNEITPTLSKDVKYKVLVDPSEFIRSAVNNVLHEVFLAAFLAVLVLFVFIGNIRNVVTAAIEIPMSIVLAFIMMKWFGINLNLISLGGLALSAGMNVDASVVVMENIFRRFEEHTGELNAKTRLALVIDAVDEVRFPILASTIASLVVFIPLAMTAGLTNAILGDLAMAVVFSHGFSAFVALVLVPTVRLQMMSLAGNSAGVGHSPIEKYLRGIENWYARILGRFLHSRIAKLSTYVALCIALASLVYLVLPQLPREIVGKPDTDWIILGVNTSGNTLVGQMEDQVSEVEDRLMKKMGSHGLYTFTQIWNANSGMIMLRLKNKAEMNTVWKELEKEFPNTPLINYWVDAWNPSELPMPDLPDLNVVVRGKEAEKRSFLAQQIEERLNEKRYFGSTNSQPNTNYVEEIRLTPSPEQWAVLTRSGSGYYMDDVSDLARVSTDGRKIGEIPINSTTTRITMGYPKDRVKSVEDLSALPIGLGGKIISLGSLARVSIEKAKPGIYREDGTSIVRLTAKLKKGEELKTDSVRKLAEADIKQIIEGKEIEKGASVVFDDPKKELNEALHQLAYAVGLSILLIFLTMVFQFGDIVNALLVLVSIPLGFIGVLFSLWVFHSSLSLNSALGVILLNGISVANSIILVDFLKRLVDRGIPPYIAALQAAKKRVRPILMTSLCTGLGMIPVAIGMGEGGRILQPLGIAVVGGLGFSMMMTLFVVPSLQVSYLQWKAFRRAESREPYQNENEHIKNEARQHAPELNA